MKVLTVRLSDEVYAAVRAAAERVKATSVSDFVRDTMLDRVKGLKIDAKTKSAAVEARRPRRRRAEWARYHW